MYYNLFMLQIRLLREQINPRGWKIAPGIEKSLHIRPIQALVIVVLVCLVVVSKGMFFVDYLDYIITVDYYVVGGVASSVEFNDEDDHESDISYHSDDVVGESTAYNCNNHANIGVCLSDWAVVHNQPRSSVNEILAIFRK